MIAIYKMKINIILIILLFIIIIINLKNVENFNSDDLDRYTNEINSNVEKLKNKIQDMKGSTDENRAAKEKVANDLKNKSFANKNKVQSLVNSSGIN